MKENKEYQEKKEQEKVVHEPTGSSVWTPSP